MDAPSEKCKKCNWWTLLGEIREDLEESLMEKQKHDFLQPNKTYSTYKQYLVENILRFYSQSAHRVCKEHWEGKR